MNAYITPHAIEQFRSRILRTSTGHAAQLIRNALGDPLSVCPGVRRDGTKTLQVRSKKIEIEGRQLQFRCVLVPPEIPGNQPVVATILLGLGGKGRGGKRSALRRASKREAANLEAERDFGEGYFALLEEAQK